METFVLELSQKDAFIVNANGDYVTKLAEPVLVKNGDTVNLRMASIDSQKSESTSIVLTEDTAVSINFSYYDVDYSKTDKQQYNKAGAWPEETYNMYSMYTDQRILQLESVQYTSSDYVPPSGGVDPTPGNIVLIYPLFSWTDPSGNHHHQSGTFQELLNDPNQYSGVCTGDKGKGIATCTYAANQFRPAVTPIVYREGSLSISGYVCYEGSVVPISRGGNAVYTNGSLAFTIVDAGQYNLHQSTASFILKAGRYEPDTLAIALTKGFSEVSIDPTIEGTDQFFSPNTALLVRNDQQAYESGIFHLIPDNKDQPIAFTAANTYQYWDGTNIPKIVIGARKFSFGFGQAGSVFQLTEAHTSVYNAASAGKENVAFYTTGTVGVDLRYHEVTSATGIIIHDMQPKSFWDDTLSLYDNLVVPLSTDANGVQYYDTADIVGKFPKESSTLTTFAPDNNRVIVDPPATLPIYIDTTDIPTNAVLGNNPDVQNDTGGWYLIEITGLNLTQSNYIDANQTRANISAVVSSQYDSNDLVTGFADSGIPYVHRGLPMNITSAHVRILDNITKEPVATIGEFNTVWIQVDKQISVQDEQSMQKALVGKVKMGSNPMLEYGINS